MQNKVVFVNRYFFPDHSATSQILSDLVFDLAADGVETVVICSRQRYGNPGESLPAREDIRSSPDGRTIRVHRVWSTRFGASGLAGRACDYVTFFLAAGIKLLSHVDQGTVVVAKTDPPLLCLVTTPIARLRNATHINWLQDIFPEVARELGIRAARGPLFGVLRRARNLCLKTATLNVVLGEKMAVRLRAEGVGADRIRIIPNWADGGQIQPVGIAGNRLRAEWGLDGRFVVAYSGNLGRAHEFDAILGAASALNDVPDIVFLFIGGGAQKAHVEAAAERLGLRNVMFRPYQPREDLSESLGAAQVHLVSLHPALEGLVVPSKFYGIAAAGRPTIFIGDPNGEIASELSAAQCGYTVQNGDAAGLAKLIASLRDDASLRERMGHNARALLERRFDRRVAVREWKSVLLGGNLPFPACENAPPQAANRGLDPAMRTGGEDRIRVPEEQ